MATRRKKATRSKSSSTPAWMWLLAGVLIGLGLAYYLFGKGVLPQAEIQPASSETAQQGSDEELAPATENRREDKSQYDFFTVLPEMEVVVPEQELRRQSEAQQAREQSRQDAAGTTASETPAVSADRYILQAGSFQQSADAEKRKARLTLLGLSTRVQTVTVNGATWHRVLVGPVNGAAQAEDVRRQLANNNIESMVTKSP